MLQGRDVERARGDRRAGRRTRRSRAVPRAARRSRGREVGPAGRRRRPGGGDDRPAHAGRRVGVAAGVRRAAAAAAPGDATAWTGCPTPQARALRTAFGESRRRARGPVPRVRRGDEPARGGERAGAGARGRRRRPLAGRRVGRGSAVRGASAGRSSGWACCSPPGTGTSAASTAATCRPWRWAAWTPTPPGGCSAERAGGPVPAEVRDALVAGTGGNPLALVELAAALRLAQLAGTEPLPGPATPDRGRRAGVPRPLPPPAPAAARTVLLVAAGDDSGRSPRCGRRRGAGGRRRRLGRRRAVGPAQPCATAPWSCGTRSCARRSTERRRAPNGDGCTVPWPPP